MRKSQQNVLRKDLSSVVKVYLCIYFYWYLFVLAADGSLSTWSLGNENQTNCHVLTYFYTEINSYLTHCVLLHSVNCMCDPPSSSQWIRLLVLSIVKIKSSGQVLSKSFGNWVVRGRFSMGHSESDGQKLVKTNKSPLCYQPRMRTATDWVSCVLCAMVTLGSGLL